jgi:hypothetical protein
MPDQMTNISFQNFGRSNTMKIQPNYFTIIILAVVLLLVSNSIVTAQNQEVTIVAPYQPVISDAYKKSLDPELVETEVEALPINYSIISEPVFTTYEISPIRPSLIDVETPGEMRRNYFRTGFGNYTMPYAELFTNSLSSSDFFIGFHARHLSSRGEIEDYANSAFSKNEVSLSVERYLKERVFAGKIAYNRDVVHYYGFIPGDYVNDSLTDEQLRQRFSMIGAEFSLLSNKKRGDELNYRAVLDFYHFDDLDGTSEMKAGLKTNFNTRNEFFDFVDKQELGADVNFDFFSNKDSLASQGIIMAEIKPYLRLNFEFLDLTVGARGMLSYDSVSGFYAYPEVRASYQVIPGYLRFYALVTGGLERNSYQKAVAENPFVSSLFPLGFTNTKYKFKGGVTGKASQSFDYNLSVSYAEVEDMLFFNNDFLMPFSPQVMQNFGNKFTGIYDNVQLTTISVELGYQQSRIFNVIFRANYHDYQLTTQAKPWHKPAMEAALSGKYMFSEKLSFAGDLFFSSKTYAQVIENGNATISENKAFADLNFGIEYRFSDRISIYANINNVMATRYFRWYNYPSQKINAMGGFTFSF